MFARILSWIKRSIRLLRWVIVALLLVLVWAKWGPMDPLFTTPRSMVLLDRNGELLGATVAKDGQWRMPSTDSVPECFAICLIQLRIAISGIIGVCDRDRWCAPGSRTGRPGAS
ncbi:MAG: hypothetical protein IPP83_00480 [Flavobacteriales bacterium]|nr:hypothetical protein [Flavobacteriales bacterium]